MCILAMGILINVKIDGLSPLNYTILITVSDDLVICNA